MTLAPVLDSPPAELLPARADTDSWTSVVREVTILAQQIAETEFVPRGLRGSVPATAAAILYGREVGLPPMTALSQIHVVDGRPGLSAEAMRALVLAAGHEIVFDETTSAICRIRGRRHRSQTWTAVEWTIDLARRAGLLRRGSGWEGYPRDMLIARATTALCRMIFPDVIHGFRSTEELDDMSEISPEPSSRGTRATVTRRRKSPPPVEGSSKGGEDPATTEAGPPMTPPTVRVPSLPGESEDEGGGADSDGATAPPSAPPPRHAGQPEEAPPPAGPDYPAPVRPPVEDEVEGSVDLVNRVTLRLVFGQLRRLGLDDDTQGRDLRLDLLSRLSNRTDLTSANDLTQDEGTQVATILSTFRDSDALDEFLATVTPILGVAEATDDAAAEDEGEGEGES